MPRDSILHTDFNRNTWWGLTNFCADTAQEGRLETGDPDSWAYLWFQLREAKDDPRWFPSGKWATVQHLEALLTKCVKEARDDAS